MPSRDNALRVERSPFECALQMFLLSALIGISFPRLCFACACGCGTFDVGTSSNFATCPGGMAFFQYDYANQNQNRHGTSTSPSENNDDKRIRTNYFTAGYKYFFNREWGIEATLPYENRLFKTAGDNGEIDSFNHSDVGDIRVQAVYSGFSPDMSTGITFGLKLANGDYTYPNFDRDTEIGTGSTDILLGAYHFGGLTEDRLWNWFTNTELDIPTLTSEGYRPGTEVDAVAGIYYNGLNIGSVKLAPLAQLVTSVRWYDRGPAADSENTGYERLIAEPGLEADINGWRIFADIGFPVVQDFRGNQLAASELYSLNISRNF